MIRACVLHGNLDSRIAISNAFIDVDGKFGNLAYSRSVFDSMSAKCIITWNSFIAGYITGVVVRLRVEPRGGFVSRVI